MASNQHDTGTHHDAKPDRLVVGTVAKPSWTIDNCSTGYVLGVLADTYVVSSSSSLKHNRKRDKKS